ncbi:MAG: ribosome biogenesis GTPase Der [Gammaproteobacteria bacterium]|nr:MAG: ribosome biogenesis GTPase Der [Gammaproteobacteria bacterium]
MLPVVAIVGRPNVGKSTLFNRLTRSRDALVADSPGLTRDRQYGTAVINERRCIVVDTGGVGEAADGINRLISTQSEQALQASDAVLLLVDARQGLTAADEAVAGQVRATGKPTVLVVNKIDGLESDVALSEFHALGIGVPCGIAAVHGRGLNGLADALTPHLPEAVDAGPEISEGTEVAVVDRPNVGKSTLINRILRTDRLVAHDMPGTTRDSIFVPFERHGRQYTFIDTAGVRRRARVNERVEKYSVIKTLQAIDAANVVILLMDGTEGVTDQDAHLLGLVLDAGRALVLAVNKWDGIDAGQRQHARTTLERKLVFVDFARIHYTSALHGSGVGNLFTSVDSAWASAARDLATPLLTQLLQEAVTAHAPPTVRGRRIKLRYAHQGGRNPPVIVVHGNQTQALPKAYRRYLARHFRKSLELEGTPVHMEFKSGDNPFKGRRNKLTPRQQRKRQRLMRHVRGRS